MPVRPVWPFRSVNAVSSVASITAVSPISAVAVVPAPAILPGLVALLAPVMAVPPTTWRQGMAFALVLAVGSSSTRQRLRLASNVEQCAEGTVLARRRWRQRKQLGDLLPVRISANPSIEDKCAGRTSAHHS